jgi:D-tyrosyl-tRNA(Tyr) deacylase
MRAVIQRVKRAQVSVGGKVISYIAQGFLVLIGVGRGDTEQDADYIAAKTAGLRVFEDQAGKMNLALADVKGSVLAVSQFTLYGDCRGGRRPSFIEAAPPDEGKRLYEIYVQKLRALGVPVQTGEFQAMMDVELVNDGPVTILLDSKKQF